VLGFHGTDLSIAHDVVLGRIELRPSVNPWDWIGHGIYFWENSPARAIEFARASATRKGSAIKTPAVVGAVLDLGHCLDLIELSGLGTVKNSYKDLRASPNFEFLKNKPAPSSGSDELLLRDLDCAVIENVHALNHFANFSPFDSVKAVFWEGDLLYPNAGFREKNHIQICIRNPNCIKGLFIPRD
jgi:hypothetical protein